MQTFTLVYYIYDVFFKHIVLLCIPPYRQYRVYKRANRDAPFCSLSINGSGIQNILIVATFIGCKFNSFFAQFAVAFFFGAAIVWR